MEKQCLCKKIMGMREEQVLILHLTGCPKDYYTREYETYSWWKKLWSTNPAKIYNEHIRQTIEKI